MKVSWRPRPRASGRNERFRAFLERQFESSRSRNPRYSLRSFARHLGVDHSTLSQILRGRRALTDAMITRIGERLGLSEEIIEHYLGPRSGRGRSSRADQQSRQLTLDAFEVISDWHHFAILELTRLASFRPDSRWIARALGISTAEVNIAISRLTRLRLLEMRDHAVWEDRSGDITMNHGELTGTMLKRIQRESHELALHAIERAPAHMRDHASITLALNTARLPEIAALVARFRRELEELADRDEARDDVYRIEISVFPLTTLNHENTE